MTQLGERAVRRLMRRIQKVHFVGIGGVGMAGIAEVMLHLGYEVSGSDRNRNLLVQRLEGLGVRVYSEHAADNVTSADVVVMSTAIPPDNPELMQAKESRIPVVQRAEMLAELMRFSQGIAVAGTHGKTTTTSLIASVLIQGGLDPTYVIGGRLNSSKSNAYLGKSEWMVAEADESDQSFLHLQPIIAVVTNIDADHLSTYEGDFQRLCQTFVEFLHHLPFYGLAVVCLDDENIVKILDGVARPYLSYGFSDAADVKAYNIKQIGHKTYFDVSLRDGSMMSDVTLNLPGDHNILNSLAAIAIGIELNVPISEIKLALQKFEGIDRRVQIHGNFPVKNGTAVLIDDYAHHPTEIAATLQAVRAAYKNKRLIAIFQPHRYTRTRDLFEDFSNVLSDVDVLVLTEVYSAGESAIAGADSRSLARSIRNRGHVDPVFIDSISDIAESIVNMLQHDDVVITLGAGSVGALPDSLIEHFANEFAHV